jgi:hypothetical protein
VERGPQRDSWSSWSSMQRETAAKLPLLTNKLTSNGQQHLAVQVRWRARLLEHQHRRVSDAALWGVRFRCQHHQVPTALLRPRYMLYCDVESPPHSPHGTAVRP